MGAKDSLKKMKINLPTVYAEQISKIHVIYGNWFEHVTAKFAN